jgi:signal transduction histidine kinase
VRPYIGRVRDWCRLVVDRHRVLAVVVGTAALFWCSLNTAMMHPPVTISATEVIIAVVTYAVFAAIAVARWPSWLLVMVSAAGAFASIAAGTPDVLISGVLFIALLAFSLARELVLVIAVTAAACGVLVAGNLMFGPHARSGVSDLSLLPWLAVAAAIGQGVRARRTQKALVEERAQRRIQGRVQEERLRIARELHDAVGHQVALISVQAGAMGCMLANDLDKARESLMHIQRASEAALEELRMTVGLLRQPDDDEPTEPAGSLGSLDELIGAFAATGLTVSCEVTGQARTLPEAVDLAAYRMIQESLTNVAKHAAGASASVRVAFRPGVLALAVEDDGPGKEGDTGSGHGLIGMRERAAAVGGWVSAGPRSGGGFQVLAELPLPAGAAA